VFLVRLQRQLSRKVGRKQYAKWVITLPPKIIEKIGWRAGEELSVAIDEKCVKITPKSFKRKANSPRQLPR